MSGAKTAMMTKIAKTTVPEIARRLEKKALTKSSLRLRVLTSEAAWVSCCICASAISVPHPGIQYRVEHVHEQVDQHEEQGSIEHDALYRGVIPAAHGIVDIQAYPRPREDNLRDDRTPHEQTRLQSDHGYRRQHGVSEGVLEDHAPRDDPLGSRGPHVVLVQDLQHAGARHPHDYGHGDGPERQGRHYEVQQPVPESREVEGEQRVHEHEPGYGGDASRRIKAARKRQKLQVDAEDHDQDHRQPEDGHAYPGERQNRGRLVEQRVLPYRGDHPDGHPHYHGDEHRERRELQGGGEPRQQFRRYGTPGNYGVAKIPPYGILEEEQVLYRHGLVQPHLDPQLVHLLLGRGLAQEYLRRVARDRPHHEEDDDRHPKQHGDDLQYPAPDVFDQGPNILEMRRGTDPRRTQVLLDR